MNRLQWETNVPIFRNRFILKGLALAVGLPFGIVIAVIIIAAGGDIAGTDAKYALWLIAVLFVLTFLLIMIVYGGKYAPGFIVDDAGIVNYTQEKQAKRGKAVNGLAVALGLFSGNLTAAGAGTLAQSKQVIRLRWKSIRKIRYYPKQYTILIRGGFSEKIAVFCTPANYPEVEAMIKEHTKAPQTIN